MRLFKLFAGEKLAEINFSVYYLQRVIRPANFCVCCVSKLQARYSFVENSAFALKEGNKTKTNFVKLCIRKMEYPSISKLRYGEWGVQNLKTIP